MILVKLVLAHLIGDFFLQPKAWVNNKRKKRWLSPALYAHVVVHASLLFLLLWDLTIWLPVLIIAVTHLFIDGIKVSAQTKHNRAVWFGIDQLCHVFILIVVWIFFWDITPPVPGNYLWVVVTGGLFLTMPSSVIIQKVMSRWSKDIGEQKEASLNGAGKYIGVLERLLVYIAVLAGSLQVIGFLLAAKSVFRFGDLTRAKDRKLTEYILIGTLLSFLLAIVTGLLIVR